MHISPDITELLVDWSKGNQEALEKLLPFVEKELHRMAHSYMRKLDPGNTLQTTAVINEAYLRLIKQNRVEWQNRAHFFAIAALTMRRFLLNYIRDTNRGKRDGKHDHVHIEDAIVFEEAKSSEILALEEALNRLEAKDERKAKVVVLRYYGGLTVKETAEVLKVSEMTVLRDWNLARAWLARSIRGDG